MSEHTQSCFQNEPNCLCLTCANDTEVCCIRHLPTHNCQDTVCVDYTPENPDKPKKTKAYKPISFENVLKGEIELCPDCLIS